MTTVLLVRHGLTRMTGPVLAGWTPGVHLDDRGRDQARRVAERLTPVPLAAVVSSPLERCQETATAILAARDGSGPGGGKADGQAGGPRTDDRFGECKYGDWTGRRIDELVKEPLWRVVQAHPSAARFPGADAESLAEMQARAVTAVRDWNHRLGPDATYLVCTHGDVIKAIVADALGLHLDMFQRIQADPCSLSVIRYTELRPFVERINDTGGEVSGLVPEPGGRPAKRRWWRRRRGADPARSSDAHVGGGAGGTGGASGRTGR